MKIWDTLTFILFFKPTKSLLYCMNEEKSAEKC